MTAGWVLSVLFALAGCILVGVGLAMWSDPAVFVFVGLVLLVVGMTAFDV